MAMGPERRLETSCGKYTEAQGGRFIKLLKLAGIPDRLVLAPNGWAGFVEFKSPTGKPTTLQSMWLGWLKAMHFPTLVCRDRETFEAWYATLASQEAHNLEPFEG